MDKVDELGIVIHQWKHRGYVASIPQIHLHAKGADLASAVAALEAKKQAFIADLKDVGELDRLDARLDPVAQLPQAPANNP